MLITFTTLVLIVARNLQVITVLKGRTRGDCSKVDLHFEVAVAVHLLLWLRYNGSVQRASKLVLVEALQFRLETCRVDNQVIIITSSCLVFVKRVSRLLWDELQVWTITAKLIIKYENHRLLSFEILSRSSTTFATRPRWTLPIIRTVTEIIDGMRNSSTQGHGKRWQIAPNSSISLFLN